jgi:predicted ATP-dependent Lon-type protease
MARRDNIISSIPENTSGLRFLRERKDTLKNQNKYKESYKVVDEISEKTLAECDLYGHAGFVNLEIKDEEGHRWTTRPNRKIMPGRWSFLLMMDNAHLKSEGLI